MITADAAQTAAATPTRSSWVAANAGSGKTRVLTNRVARLLLMGTAPEKILCLTYTKAAAAEMQTRLFQTLGRWAMMDDAELRGELTALDAAQADIPEAGLAQARTLFARALETPGGLKIQTIHAFCEALLRRFPVEAGVAPQFSVMDDRDARELRVSVLDELARVDPEAMRLLAINMSGDDPDGLLQEIGRNRSAFGNEFDAQALAAALGVDPDDSPERIYAETVLPGDLATVESLIPLLAASGKTDSSAGETLASALKQPPDMLCETLEKVFLTGAGAKSPFSAKIGAFPTKGLRTAYPELMDALEPLMLRVEAARPRRLGLLALRKSTALNIFARAWLRVLDARKAAYGLLDFDDMIDRTRHLLNDTDTASWVLWKLDGGLDHILVDEAQDTSPVQWQVVQALSDEFFSGFGAREVDRTVFVVGDEKQSIYSFQGADPAAFGKMNDYFHRVLSGLEEGLQQCELIHSFRSAEPVLSLVDAVFDGPAGEGLTNDVTHSAHNPDKPGRVELWPFLEKPDKQEEPPWSDPVDMPAPDDPVQVMAKNIAGRISEWLRDGRVLPGHDRAIRAGDVLILVQSRNERFHSVIRELKRANVPVAGADVLNLNGELAARDLLAVLRVINTVADDLSLATVLRSPLGGIDEDDLFTLAHGRKGMLWPELRVQEAEKWQPCKAMISDLLGQADFLRPFEMLQRILIRHNGRRKLVARLGAEAEDGIDALLDQALAFERSGTPGLTGFLAWMESDEVTIKRRVEEGADQVRVMTVHGAKGLEAPIVFLPDTAKRQEGRHPPQVMEIGNGQPAWRVPTDSAPDVMRDAEADRRALAVAENMRLLYVAMTRAESWLIVCGAGGKKDTEDNSWYGLIRNGLHTLAPREIPGSDGVTLCFDRNWTDQRLESGKTAQSTSAELPTWAREKAESDAGASTNAVSPSRLGGAHVVFDDPDEIAGEGDSLPRGDAVHLLLEGLLQYPEADWPDVADHLLPDGLPDRDEIVAEAIAVLRTPEFSELFGPDGLSEVPLVAELNGTRIEGRIDRMLIRDDKILAVDFKSNRTIPESPNAVPEAILRQMGAYQAALQQIWPGSEIEVAILWTRTAELMYLPHGTVTGALDRAGLLDPAIPRS